MERVTIKTPSKQYPVVIGYDILTELNEFISTSIPKLSKILVVVDEEVHRIHGDALKFLQETHEVHYFVAPRGEQSKSLNIFDEVISYALTKQLDRNSLVVGLGGGAIGDLSGFVASTYMRGISFIQVPTTILAHDSAVGGKVAINHSLGKNMIGHFYQPEAVFYELNFLKTLPQEEVRSGMAEVIKHALIADNSFYETLRKKLTSFSTLDKELLTYCLKRGIEIKGSIVEKDERETGIRAFLNFGHTYGHAIESASGYGKRTHGECVMIGMIFALFLSMKQGEEIGMELEEFVGWIKNLGYNLAISEDLSFDVLFELMTRDKKSEGGSPRFVLLREVGKPYLHKIDHDMLKAADQYIRTLV